MTQLALALRQRPSCQNIIGEPRGRETKFCGKPAVPGCSYCAACRAVLYRGQGKAIKAPHEANVVHKKTSPRGEGGQPPVDVVIKRERAVSTRGAW